MHQSASMCGSVCECKYVHMCVWKFLTPVSIASNSCPVAPVKRLLWPHSPLPTSRHAGTHTLTLTHSHLKCAVNNFTSLLSLSQPRVLFGICIASRTLTFFIPFSLIATLPPLSLPQMKQRTATSSNNNSFGNNSSSSSVNINNNSQFNGQQQQLQALTTTTVSVQQQQQQLSKSSQIVTEWEDGIIFDVDDPDFCSTAPAAVVIDSCAAALRNLNFIGNYYQVL